jgi:hypothetical protein
MTNNTNDLQKAEQRAAAAEAKVAEAQAVVTRLEEKRAAAVQRGTDLADERADIAFKAHTTKDEKASKRLAEIHQAIAIHGSELASLDAALRAAATKVEHAEAALTVEQRRSQIKEQQKHSKEFRELGPFLDKATDNLRRGLKALQQNAASVGKDVRYVQMLHRVLQVALFDTPFRDAFGVPGHDERKSFATFSGVINQWCDSCDAGLKHELAAIDGERTNTTEAA